MSDLTGPRPEAAQPEPSSAAMEAAGKAWVAGGSLYESVRAAYAVDFGRAAAAVEGRGLSGEPIGHCTEALMPNPDAETLRRIADKREAVGGWGGEPDLLRRAAAAVETRKHDGGGVRNPPNHSALTEPGHPAAAPEPPLTRNLKGELARDRGKYHAAQVKRADALLQTPEQAERERELHVRGINLG